MATAFKAYAIAVTPGWGNLATRRAASKDVVTMATVAKRAAVCASLGEFS